MPDIFLRSGEAIPADIRLRDTTISDAGAITGTSAVSFGFATAATGLERFSGQAASAFAFTEGQSGLLNFTGIGTSLFAFAESAQAVLRLSGSSQVAFGFLSSGAALLRFIGSGASSFAQSETGSGGETFSGTGAPAFGFSSQGSGQAPSQAPAPSLGGMPIPNYPAPFMRLHEYYQPPNPAAQQQIWGFGQNAPFSFAIQAQASVNDDALIELLVG